MRISDWSSDVCSSDLKDGKGEPLGEYMLRLAHEQLDRDIDILRWNFGGLKQFVVPRILSLVVRWKLTRSISFRLDSAHPLGRSEEHTSELQSLMRISYAVFCLKKKRMNKCQTSYNECNT